MPAAVSLILNPYANDIKTWQENARADGHELWLQMPIQNENFPLDDPGPNGLLTRVSLKYNQDRVNWLLGRTVGYAGITAYTDSAIEQSTTMFSDLIGSSIFERGLGFFELNNNSNNFISQMADERNAPYTRSHIKLKSFVAGSNALQTAENKINANKQTVITVQPTMQNVAELKGWIERLQRQNIQVVPLSAIAAK